MNKIKELRLRQGLTQKELSNILGVNRSTIALWERGTNHPRMKMLPKLVNVSNCRLEDILSINMWL